MTHLVLALLIALTTQVSSASGLEGAWQGTLVAGPAQLRLVFNVTRTTDGIYLGTLISLDQGGMRIPMDRIEVTGESVRLEVRAVNGVFAGTISGDQLKGTWTQGGPLLPLELTRTAAPAEPSRPADAPPPPAAENPLFLSR